MRAICTGNPGLAIPPIAHFCGDRSRWARRGTANSTLAPTTCSILDTGGTLAIDLALAGHAELPYITSLKQVIPTCVFI
jgi:hypothetical protein